MKKTSKPVKSKRDLYIAIDYDGTIVKHEYPKIGPENPGAIFWMQKWQEFGAKLILYTMRGGQELKDAVSYCQSHGIVFWAVNENPTQINWTDSRKVYAHYYVDDAIICGPLIHPTKGKPYVDWSVVGPAGLDLIQVHRDEM